MPWLKHIFTIFYESMYVEFRAWNNYIMDFNAIDNGIWILGKIC
jgi:hypothetical protein